MTLDVGSKRIYDRDELTARADRIDELRQHATGGRLTVLYAARDGEHNNAVVLTELLRD